MSLTKNVVGSRYTTTGLLNDGIPSIYGYLWKSSSNDIGAVQRLNFYNGYANTGNGVTRAHAYPVRSLI